MDVDRRKRRERKSTLAIVLVLMWNVAFGILMTWTWTFSLAGPWTRLTVAVDCAISGIYVVVNAIAFFRLRRRLHAAPCPSRQQPLRLS